MSLKKIINEDEGRTYKINTIFYVLPCHFFIAFSITKRRC